MGLGRLVTTNVLGRVMEIDRTMFILMCLDEGIIPPPKGRFGSLLESPSEFIEQLSPEEARVAKRKFRKLQRKARKKLEQDVKSMRTKKGMQTRKPGYRRNRKARCLIVDNELAGLNEIFGTPGSNPTKQQRRARRDAVMKEIWKKIPKHK